MHLSREIKEEIVDYFKCYPLPQLIREKKVFYYT